MRICCYAFLGSARNGPPKIAKNHWLLCPIYKSAVPKTILHCAMVIFYPSIDDHFKPGTALCVCVCVCVCVCARVRAPPPQASYYYITTHMKCIWITMYSLVMSPFSHDFLEIHIITLRHLQYFNTVNYYSQQMCTVLTQCLVFRYQSIKICSL